MEVNIQQSNARESPDFYVSPEGNDKFSGKLARANKGNRDGPFATLARARDAVRELPKVNGKKRIIVQIRGGRYHLAETVVFTESDGGGESTEIVYEAYPGEKPVLSSGVRVEGWQKARKSGADLRLFKDAVRPFLWLCEVPAYIASFRTLNDNAGLLSRAREKGFSPTAQTLTFGTQRGPREAQQVLHFPKGSVRNWTNLSDPELLVLPTVPWSMNILAFESVDETGGTAKTSIPASYMMGKNWFHKPSCWIENTAEGLTRPGQWMFDSAQRRIFLWPRNGDCPDGIFIPLLKELLRVEGENDPFGTDDKPVKNLTFRGLSFTCGDRDIWTADSRGLQHDWEMFDCANALLRFRGAENCTVENCHFYDSGGSAIRFDLHAKRNRVVNNSIENIGATPVLLAGYGPGTKDVNKNNTIRGNYIHDFGLIRWHSSGIFVWQSGENEIINNELHDMPFIGICISGARPSDAMNGDVREVSRTLDRRYFKGDSVRTLADWATNWRNAYTRYLHGRQNLVQDNHIYKGVQVMADGNGIYISGAGTGNTIRRNYVHHIDGKGSQSGIRTDDWVWETEVRENIISHCSGGGFTLKHVNHFENNIVAALEPAVDGYVLLRGSESSKGSRIKNNIFCHKGGAQEFYCEQSKITFVEDLDVDGNLYFNTEYPEFCKTYLEKKRKRGIEINGVAGDPLFIDIENENFKLSTESPALKAGFRQIDCNAIGRKKP